MQPSTLISALALLLASGALFVGLSGAGDTAPLDETRLLTEERAAVTGGAPVRGARPSSARLEARVERLEAEVVMLRRALGQQQREGVASATAGAEGAPLPSEAATEAAVVEALAKAPEVSARIESLVDERLQAERNARFDRMADHARERDDDMIAAIRKEHDLDDDEGEKLSALLDAERDQVFAHLKEAREQGTWRQMRQTIDQVRTETDTNVASLLSEEAYATWSSLREEHRGPGGRGRRPPPNDR